jgi:hypothetical protein
MISLRPSKLYAVVLAAVLFGLMFPKQASANTYEYTGGMYTSCYGTYTPCLGLNSVTGWLTTDALGPNLTNQVIDPTSFSFSDGLITLDSSNTVTSYFEFSTDAEGNITNWSINATLYSIYYAGPYELGNYETIYSSPSTDWSIYNSYFTFSVPISFPDIVYCDATQSYSYECGANTYQGYLYSGASDGANPGVWTDPPDDPVSAPEPPSLLMLGSGLIGLALWKGKTNFGARTNE